MKKTLNIIKISIYLKQKKKKKHNNNNNNNNMKMISLTSLKVFIYVMKL